MEGIVVGLFFERVDTSGGDDMVAEIAEALRQAPGTEAEVIAEAQRRAPRAKRAAKADSAVKPKKPAITIGFVIVAILVGLTVVLAAWVDPQLIAQAQEAVKTTGYVPPELQAKKVSEAAQTMMLAWSTGLIGAIFGDGVGTATSK